MFWLNGVACQESLLSDRGLHYGDGVFRTMAVVDRQVLNLAQHEAALHDDAQRLALPWQAPAWRAQLHALLPQLPERAILKYMLTRGAAGRGYAFGPQSACSHLFSAHPAPFYPREPQRQGAQLRLCQLRLALQPALAGIKHLNRLEQVLARAEWQEPGWDEGLLLDQRGMLVSGVMSSLFWRVGAQLFAPDLSQAGVHGASRRAVLAFCAQQQQPVQLGFYPLAFLRQADEVFLCNSVFGVWPVRELTGPDLGERWTWPLGAWAQRLQQRCLPRPWTAQAEA